MGQGFLCNTSGSVDNESTIDYVYSGTSTFEWLYDDNNNKIGWVIVFYDSGNLYFNQFEEVFALELEIDVGLVGGGGPGGRGYYNGTAQAGGGGGGGQVKTQNGVKIASKTSYLITVGEGGKGLTSGSGAGDKGGASVAFGVTADGGNSGKEVNGGTSSNPSGYGNGGNGCGIYGSSETSGVGDRASAGQNGLEIFSDFVIPSFTSGYLFGAGGGGAQACNAGYVRGDEHGGSVSGGKSGGGNGNWSTSSPSKGSDGKVNSGGGGGGSTATPSGVWNPGNGGSGIVVIRHLYEQE